MKKGFTLAEVLITLAIIGIVAALTIPTLVAKNEKKQLYTQFMKSYNTFSNALNLAVAENGDPEGWAGFLGDLDAGDVQTKAFNKFFAPYLKIAKVCDSSNAAECFPGAVGGYKNFAGTVLYTINELAYVPIMFVLQDGASVTMNFSFDSHTDKFDNVTINIDTNGGKGPNVLGRDLLMLEYGKGSVYNLKTDNYTLKSLYSYVSEDYKTDSYGNEYPANTCSPTGPITQINGFGCAARLLSEGGMNY